MSTPNAAHVAIRRRSTGRQAILTALRGALRLLLILASMALLIPSDGHLGAARVDLVLRQAIGPQGFRLVDWERVALLEKAHSVIARPGAELTPREQHDLVVAFFGAVGEIEQLQTRVERIYADPQQTDPHAAAAPLQAQLDALRSEQERRQPAVEWILQFQVAAVLAAEGITHLATPLTPDGLVLPPVSFRFAESPNYLIISPRHRITMQKGVYLDPTLAVSQMEAIEGQVTERLDVSALVEGTGGFSSYPTMIIEYPGMDWVLSTIAHEWVHTYLAFHDLGWRYYDSGAMRTINETVASIIGDEIGRLVLERYYPDKVPPTAWPAPKTQQPENRPAPAFSFGLFMRETRLTTDRLLAEGKVSEAEAYMEGRRKELVERGYLLRKLNQAYFAFHGSYAVGPGATDPIGGKLGLLRRQSSTLLAFVRTVASFRAASDLDAAIGHGDP